LTTLLVQESSVNEFFASSPDSAPWIYQTTILRL
jgi:hypothetical protein